MNVDKSTAPVVHGGVAHSGVPFVQQPQFSDHLTIATPSFGASVPVLPNSIGHPTSIASADLQTPGVLSGFLIFQATPSVGQSPRSTSSGLRSCGRGLPARLFQDQSLSFLAAQLVREIALPSGVERSEPLAQASALKSLCLHLTVCCRPDASSRCPSLSFLLSALLGSFNFFSGSRHWSYCLSIHFILILLCFRGAIRDRNGISG